jgi:hypothetical protein
MHTMQKIIICGLAVMVAIANAHNPAVSLLIRNADRRLSNRHFILAIAPFRKDRAF